MAHNTHIPWTILSSHLKFTPTSTAHKGQTDLYPRFLPLQGREITHFTKAFTTTLLSFSSTERSKYPSPTPIPPHDEQVISSTSVKKIQETVSNYRSSNPRSIGRKPCHYDCWRYECCCSPSLSLYERTLRYWVENLDCESTDRRSRSGSCSCYTNIHADVLELSKTLLLHGEIGTLLKIAVHPEVHFERKWEIPYRWGGYGFAELMRCTLLSYVFLNITFLHPETWTLAAKREFIESKKKMGSVYTEEQVDYRNTTGWQKVLSRCTGYRQFDAHTYPHRLFYGVKKQAYDGEQWRYSDYGREYRPPLTPGIPILAETQHHVPNSGDVHILLFYLRLKGLPMELGVKVVEFAGYKPERRLIVKNDPFDERNREELKKYLRWCWNVLVWVDMLMREGGDRVNWEEEVKDAVRELWGGKVDGRRKMWRCLSREEEEAVGALEREGERNENENENERKLSIPGERRVVFT